MSIKLPEPVEIYFSATNMPDEGAFLSIFSDDAVVIDDGKTYEGADAVKEWAKKHHFQNSVLLEITEASSGFSKTIVTAKVDGDFDKSKLPDPLLLDFDFTVNADKIEKLVISFTNPRLEKLPEVINTFFRAKNAFDSEALAGCFTENAVLYDEERELRGRNVVCSHIMEANSKAKVKTEVDHAIALKGETIVVATLHGDFPGSPAALDFHFTLEGQKIGALNITLLREQQ